MQLTKASQFITKNLHSDSILKRRSLGDLPNPLSDVRIAVINYTKGLKRGSAFVKKSSNE